MKAKFVVTALSLIAFSVPAFASMSYYVVQSSGGGKCEVTSNKPDDKKVLDVGHKIFKTKADANAAMKTMAVCK